MSNGSVLESGTLPVTSEGCYDRLTIQLHWATAILVGLLWSIAQIIDLFPKGTPKIAVRSVHISLGVVLGVVLGLRIVWRSRSGRWQPPSSERVADYLAKMVHWGLYAVLVSVVVLGILNAWARGDSFFGLFRISKLYPGIPRLKPSVEYLHKILANALMILAAAHALAAAGHYYVLRDRVLQRMLPASWVKRGDL